MASIIFYATDGTYLNKAIDQLVDCTPSKFIDEIIVCDDANIGFTRPGVSVLHTNRIGRAKAWDAAVDRSRGDQLVFMKASTKVSTDWLEPLLALLSSDPESIVSPVVHTLDLALWMTETNRWKRFGWRWDLNLYNRAFVGRLDSPSVSSSCFACNRAWLRHIGGFDVGMGVGAGEDIELSLRSWLMGGRVLVADDSMVATALEIDSGPGTVNNLARIVEAWLPGQASYFYASRGVLRQAVETGRLSNLVQLQGLVKHPVEWFLANCQPELFGLYDLRGSAAGKTVAVVGPGPTLDYVDMAVINRCDIVIGVDHVGKLIDCDFVLTDAVDVADELRQKYPDNKFVVPLALRHRVAGQLQASVDLLPLSHQFELDVRGSMPVRVDPPFCDFDDLTLTAIHFALFLGPRAITVVGCDNKFIGGNSHSLKIESYRDNMFIDGDNVRRRFAFVEHGLSCLGRLAHALKVPLLRVGHL